MRLPHLLLASAILGSSFVEARPSNGAIPPDRVCWITDSDQLVCMSDAEIPGAEPGGDLGVQEASARPTAYWVTTLLGEPNSANNDFSGPCTAPQGTAGRTFLYVLRSATTGEVLERFTRCVAVGDDPTESDDVLPPAAPTRDELVDVTPIPLAQVIANPAGRGLTGLESWFWTSSPASVEAAATVRGWTVAGTLTPTSWVWRTGDGRTYSTPTSGSPDQPAVRHVYEAKDTWSLDLEITWSGSYTVSGFGTTFTVAGLTTAQTTSLSYPVIEIRGVLDNPDEVP